MPEQMDTEYSVIGKNVDILFNASQKETAHERQVVGIADGLLICVAPDGVTEWYPLPSILAIIDRNNPRNIIRTKSYYGAS